MLCRSEQIGSPCAHRSIVLPAKAGLKRGPGRARAGCRCRTARPPRRADRTPGAGVVEPETRLGHGDHEVGRGGAQRIAAEHLAGVRASCRHRIERGRSCRWRPCDGSMFGGIVDPVGADRHFASCRRSELTSASPTWPRPGGSSRPRAKTTSAPGQAADAAGISAGAINHTAAASDAAAANLNNRLRDMPHAAMLRAY